MFLFFNRLKKASKSFSARSKINDVTCSMVATPAFFIITLLSRKNPNANVTTMANNFASGVFSGCEISKGNVCNTLSRTSSSELVD